MDRLLRNWRRDPRLAASCGKGGARIAACPGRLLRHPSSGCHSWLHPLVVFHDDGKSTPARWSPRFCPLIGVSALFPGGET